MKNNKELVILAGRGGGGGGGTDANAVHYTADTGKTDAEKAQARTNIGAEPEKFVVTVSYDSDNDAYVADKTFAEIKAAYDSGKDIVAEMSGAIFRLYQYQYGTDPFMGGISGVAAFFNDSVTMGLYNIQISYVNQHERVDVIQGYYAPRTNVEDVDGATVSISPEANTIYHCGELTSLTITSPPATGEYTIVFTSGSTPTVTTIPATILGLESFSAEANTLYEINVLDNRAVVGSWAVSA